jgi:hypothetical protein
MRHAATIFLGALIACAMGGSATAQTLIPGPGDEGHDSALEAKAEAFDRQIHAFLTPSLGWGLEAEIGDADARAAVEAFIASGERDFQEQSGLHPYEVVDRYDEFGDLGMFGGVQAAGDAFRYAVLRDTGAGEARVSEARDHLLAAMDGLHWYMAITGVPGVVARGLRRVLSQSGEPPLPGEAVETTPLFSPTGAPLPAVKEPTWRADESGQLPFLIWLDDTSKDQLDGYVFALGAVYDVVADDPSIPRDLVERLVGDARALGHRLMERVEITPGRSVDLVIMDADGRPTRFHDLSAEEVSPGAVLDFPLNGFNAWMALSILRTIYHITGDETFGRFYAEELVGRRGYLQVSQDTMSVMYTGASTNYSNVNMAFVAAYGLLRYETDVELGAQIRAILETELYVVDGERGARGLGQSFFDVMYAAFRLGGSILGPGADALVDGTATLVDFPSPPYWDPLVENCDATEIAALTCTAIDGSTLELSPDPGWGGRVVATTPLPVALQPPSNFHWRSDPHSVNGGGGTRLNPGGDFHAAYWMGRMLRRTLGDGSENLSPIARALPAPAAAPPAAEPEGGGCACTTRSRQERHAGVALVVLAGLVATLTRRRARVARRNGQRPRR